MNCPDWEERIVLHAGGDLAPQLAVAAARHLAECESCRTFSEELKQTLEVIREMHAEPLDPSAYAAVRTRVLQRIPQKPKRAWRLAWVAGFAALAPALGILLFPRPVPPPRIAFAHPAAAPMQQTISRPLPLAPAIPMKPKKRMAPKPRVPEPLLVRLITDDPNVVIYWIAN